MIIKENKEFFLDYLTDSSNLQGGAEFLFLPQTEEDIVEVVRDAAAQQLPLTVCSARTGNVGGAVPMGGALMGMERLSKTIKLDTQEKYIAVEAGVSLQELEQAVNLQGLSLMSYPTEKLALSGGAVSTCCSGLRSFKYGSIRNFVKRIRVVLTTGEILDIERGKYFVHGRMFNTAVSGRQLSFPLPAYQMPQVKNQAGYFVEDDMDLIDLFIGSEGTLGVISYVEFYLKELPPAFYDTLIFFDGEKDAAGFCEDVKRPPTAQALGLTALEFFDTNSLDVLKNEYAQLIRKKKAAVYVEYEVARREEENELLRRWEVLYQKHHIDYNYCYVGMTQKDKYFLYTFRHKLPETINQILRQRGQRKLSTDCAVPPEKFQQMYDAYKKIGGSSGLEHVLFGHIGENHLHFNFLPRNDDEYKKAAGLIMVIVKEAISLGGTFSAEHGVGKTRKQYLPLLFSAKHIRQMKTLKHYFDPHNILGKGNIFD